MTNETVQIKQLGYIVTFTHTKIEVCKIETQGKSIVHVSALPLQCD